MSNQSGRRRRVGDATPPAGPHPEHVQGDRGATATEYALLVAFVAIAIAAGLFAFGNSLSGFYTAIASAVGAVLP